MKKIIISVVLAIWMLPCMFGGTSLAVVYHYGFNAGCDGGKIDSDLINGHEYYIGRTNRLASGCLVQFIYAGSNEAIDPPSPSGGTTGDDLILISGMIGSDEVYGDIATSEGEFWYKYSGSIEADSPPKIYVRSWSTYEAEIFKACYYGNSPVLSVNYLPALPDDQALQSLETANLFDALPPDKPKEFKAAAEPSGAIMLTWKADNGQDMLGTRLVMRTGRYPTMENDGVILCNVSTLAAQSYRHTGLTENITYYYAAFSFDNSSNFSTPALASEVSHDILPPSVLSTLPGSGETSINPAINIEVRFSENMSRESSESALRISPTVEGYFSWPLASREVFTPNAGLLPATTYVCTVDANAKDLAGNPLASNYSWWFRTASGHIPTISLLKIGGFKLEPGETISAQPKVNAYIIDPDLPPPQCGIVSIEVLAGGLSYFYSSPNINSIFNSASGYLDFRFPKALASGTYDITVRAWDLEGNITQESVSGLVVKSGSVKLDSPVMFYPYQIESGKGGTIAYKLNIDTTVYIQVYSIRGLIYTKECPAGTPGGTAGYNEFFWDGLTGTGNSLGNGIYIVKILNSSKQPVEGGTARFIIKNRD